MSGLIPPPGLRRLGSLNFTATAASVGPITIPACSLLVIDYVITGYSNNDVAAFQFNADTTAANYASWFAAMSNAAPPVNSQSGSNVGTVAMIPISGLQFQLGRRGRMIISNVATVRKVISIETANESATTTLTAIERGVGEWLNTTAQITQVKMLDVGANNINAGSFAIIYGDNP